MVSKRVNWGADGGTGPRHRHEGDVAGPDGGNAPGQREQVPREAGFLPPQRLVKDAQVGR